MLKGHLSIPGSSHRSFLSRGGHHDTNRAARYPVRDLMLSSYRDVHNPVCDLMLSSCFCSFHPCAVEWRHAGAHTWAQDRAFFP